MLRALGLIILGLLAQPVLAPEEVDLELVHLADSSGSIDNAEIPFQRQGYASAITDPAVLAAIANTAYRRSCRCSRCLRNGAAVVKAE